MMLQLSGNLGLKKSWLVEQKTGLPWGAALVTIGTLPEADLTQNTVPRNGLVI